MYQTEHPAMGGQLTNFMYKVYGWMSFALVLTAGTAYYVASTPEVFAFFFNNRGLIFGMFILQLALVIGLSAFLHKMNWATAFVAFLAYAASVGVTLSIIFQIYTTASIYSTFLVTAGMFGGMCLYGYFTGADLTAAGSISIMMLWGLILGGVVNMFLQSPGMQWVLSIIGVVVFTLLTAYDTQKLKRIGQQMIADQEMLDKVAILGALTLYLDFINLFMYLLRFMGKRREN